MVAIQSAMLAKADEERQKMEEKSSRRPKAALSLGSVSKMVHAHELATRFSTRKLDRGTRDSDFVTCKS